MLTFRSASLDDAPFVADVVTARRGDEPADPKKLAHWWRSADPEWTNDRWLVERRTTPIGYAYQTHPPWAKLPERYSRLGCELLPADHVAAHLGEGYDFVERRAAEDGALKLSAYAREDDGFTDAFLRQRGYSEDRRSKGWELDLVANRERLTAMTEASRARMRSEGISLLTVDRDRDPEKLHRIYEMSEEAAEDVPRTIPHIRQPFAIFMHWFESPALRLDRMWIAREADDIVGVSVLAYPPIRGNVWTDWTGTARRVRGRGVARALKLETVMQAIALGVTRVRTENDGANAPILHLNADMGYVRIPGWIQHLRDAS